MILVVHNIETYLPTMLASLERNLDVDFELIAIDDASTDGTPQLLEAATSRLPMLHTIRSQARVGAASARNLGLDHATGRLITFIDGDDWLAPGHFRALVDSIDGLGCDMVRTDYVETRGLERVLHRAPWPHNTITNPRMSIMPINRETMVDYPFSWAGVYKASLGSALRWMDGLHTATDRPWIWQLHREATSFATIDHAGLYYRREVDGSLTTIGDERRLHMFAAYENVLDQVRDEPDIQPKAVRQFLGVLVRHIGMLDMYEAQPRRQFDELARAALAKIDPDLYRRSVMRDERRKLLDPYLPAGLRA